MPRAVNTDFLPVDFYSQNSEQFRYQFKYYFDYINIVFTNANQNLAF